MSGLPWYAHNLTDYERKTAHLSMLEHGAYRLLLDRYYSTGIGLPLDHDQIAKIIRASSDAERSAMESVLSEFFVKKRGRYHQKRADEELAKAAEISETKRKSGSLGGIAARGKSGRKPNGKKIAHAIAEELQGNAHKHLHKQIDSSLRSESIDACFILPSWVPQEAWNGFVEMRTKIKAKMTDKAMTLAVSELDKLRSRGHDPGAVLNQSTFRNWKGLFEINGESHANGRRSAHAKAIQGAEAYIRKLQEGGDSDSPDSLVPALPSR